MEVMLKKLIRHAFPEIPMKEGRREALTKLGGTALATVALTTSAKANIFDDIVSAFSIPEAEEETSRNKQRKKRTLSAAEKQDIRKRVTNHKRKKLSPGEGAKSSLKAWENADRQIHTLILKRGDHVWTLDVRDLTQMDWETFKESCRDWGYKGDAPPDTLFEAHKAIMLGNLINVAETFAHPDQGVFTINIRSCYRSEEHQREIVIKQLIREAEGGQPAGSGVTSEHCDFLAWDLNLADEGIPEDVGFAASAAMRCRSGRYPDQGFYHTGNSGTFSYWSRADRVARKLVSNCKDIIGDFKKRRPKRTVKDPTPLSPPKPEPVAKLPEPAKPTFAKADMGGSLQQASHAPLKQPAAVQTGSIAAESETMLTAPQAKTIPGILDEHIPPPALQEKAGQIFRAIDTMMGQDAPPASQLSKFVR